MTISNEKFRVRLRVRLGKALTSDASSLGMVIDGHDVEIKSQNKKEALRDTKWVIVTAGNFTSEKQAYRFGERLRTIISVASLFSSIGVDVGSDRPTTWIDEQFSRSLGLISQNERIHANVHGLMVHLDDGNSRFILADATAVTTSDPDVLIKLAEKLGGAFKSVRIKSWEAINILNHALLSAEPLTQVVMAISVIEALADGERWSDRQKLIIKDLAEILKDDSENDPEKLEVANALTRTMQKVSVRQGVMRVLNRLELSYLRKEWDHLYDIRSKVFHGVVHLNESDQHKLSYNVMKFCRAVIIALLKEENIDVSDYFYGIDVFDQ